MAITGPQKQKATFGVRAVGCVTFFWLVGGEATEWYSRNRAQTEITILHLGGGPSFVELKDIVMYTSWVGTQTLPQDCTAIWLFFLFLYPHPSLISNCLNLSFGIHRRSRRLNEAYILQTRMENTEHICTSEPHGVLLSFNSGSWATMTLITASVWRIDTELEVFLSSKS